MSRRAWIALVGFIALTIAVHFVPAIRELDRLILQRAITDRSNAFTGVARATTLLGSTAFTAILSSILAGVVWSRRRSGLAAAPPLAWIGTVLSVFAVKSLVDRARPDSTVWLTHAGGSSYPSQHAALSACAFLTLAWIGPTLSARGSRAGSWWWAATILPVLVAGTRVYLGVHFLTDVAAGLCLGAFWTAAIAHLFRNRSSTLPSSESRAQSPGSRR